MENNKKIRIFIGSSEESIEIANTTKKILEKSENMEVIMWKEMIEPGETLIEALIRETEKCDYAILVISADDKITKRGEKYLVARDNVVFELGLFMSKLGRARTFMLYDAKARANLPTDIRDIYYIEYILSIDEEKENALNQPCKKIINIINKKGILERNIKVFPTWQSELLYTSIARASSDSEIRIIQTWLPDLDQFRQKMEDLLRHHNKKFKIRLLLMNNNQPTKKGTNILLARIKLRDENWGDGANNIEQSITRFKKMKEDVEIEWNKNKKNNNEKDFLDLIIRQYDFLPFGPYYQIGENILFIGFYPNYCSSINAPMIAIEKNQKECWNRFITHWEKGWKDAECSQSFPKI